MKIDGPPRRIEHINEHAITYGCALREGGWLDYDTMAARSHAAAQLASWIDAVLSEHTFLNEEPEAFAALKRLRAAHAILRSSAGLKQRVQEIRNRRRSELEVEDVRKQLDRVNV